MTLCDRLRRGLPPPFGVIDMHGHVGRYAYPIADLASEGLLRVLRRAGIETILCSHMQCMSADADWGNAQVLECLRQGEGRLRGYAAVFPSDPQTVHASVSGWIRAGFIGIKLHDANQFRYDDPAYEPAYRLANEHRLPVLMHCWGRPAQFAAAVRTARAYPDLTVILAHGGSANPEGYAQAAQAAPNILIDTCLSRSPLGMIEFLVARAGPERIVFGSDGYFYSITQQLGKIMGAELPDSVKRLILRDNALRVLGRVRAGGVEAPAPPAEEPPKTTDAPGPSDDSHPVPARKRWSTRGVRTPGP
ncbi:MAG: amidohydrolase family protein [Lentisphaeria bacterium]|nr:amidohydrolase family protein [Lentisphaeria bacterium]